MSEHFDSYFLAVCALAQQPRYLSLRGATRAPARTLLAKLMLYHPHFYRPARTEQDAATVLMRNRLAEVSFPNGNDGGIAYRVTDETLEAVCAEVVAQGVGRED